MDHRHDNEKIQFKKLFQQQGLDQFNKRFKVLELFLKTDATVDAGALGIVTANTTLNPWIIGVGVGMIF